MTVTVVFGSTGDGLVLSNNATYATARNGSNLTVNTTDATAGFGQTGPGTYFIAQAFVGFAYPAILADEVVVSAVVRVQLASPGGTGVNRNLEFRGRPWSAGGLTTADWANGTTLATSAGFATVNSYQSAGANRNLYAGSEQLRSGISAATFQEFVVVTDRQRVGTVPTQDEGGSIVSADSAGTTSDPALIISTVRRSILHGVLGAQVRVSTGWMYLESDGAASPTVTLHFMDEDYNGTDYGALPIGTGASQFATPVGAQALTLVAGPDDSVYVVGRNGAASNSLSVQAWQRVAGDWTARPVVSVPLPAHSAWVNQVTGTYQVVAGAHSLFLVAGHQPGDGVSTAQPDLAWVILDQAPLLSGSAVVKASGSAVGTLTRSAIDSDRFCGFANETGTGLDVASDLVTSGWVYTYGFQRGQLTGDNSGLDLGRGIYGAGSTSLSLASRTEDVTYGTKDASAKVRIVPCGPGVVAAVSADSDPGWGLTVAIEQHSGTDPTAVSLGSATLASESIPSMPDGPTVATSQAWDAIYSNVDNSLWIYYVDVATPTRLMRTAYSLDTYQATRVEREVMVAPHPIRAVRVARNAPAGDLVAVSVAWVSVDLLTSDGTVWLDSYNVPPLAPTLNHHDGADATQIIALSWTFHDPNLTDAQSAYRLEIQDTADSSTVYDSTKTVSGNQFVSLPGGTLANGKVYRWRVMTWDQEDAVSPWSGWEILETAAGGTVAITAPAVDNAPGIITSDVTVQWSATGTVQSGYRVKLYRVGSSDTLISDSGWVTSTATSRVVSGLISDVQYRVEVQVRNGAGVTSNVGTRLITSSYGSPEAPMITLTAHPEGGYMLISVVNPAPTGDRPDTAYNYVLRRPAGGTEEMEQIAQIAPNTSYRDYTAAIGTVYEYQIRAVSA